MHSIRITGWWIAAAIGALLLLFGSRLLAFYVDWLWFGEMGQRAVFWTVLTAQAQLALAFGTSLFLVMLLNLWLARRATPALTPRYEDFPLRVRIGRMARAGLSIALLASTLAIGILAALEATNSWDTWLRFRHAMPFHQADPIFHHDIGFYLFTYPFWRFLYARLFVAVIVIFAGTALIYYLDRAMEFLQGYARVASSARAHLSILLGVLMLVKAWGYRLDAYELLLTPGGVVHGLGAGYTEVYARLPALSILMVLALVAAAGFFLNAYLRLLWLPLATIGLMIVASLLVGSFYPGFVQRFHVTPDEGRVQAPFIRYHLDHTRAAYGLDRITVRDFPAQERLPASAVQRDAATIDNIRLWDYETLQMAYQSLQSLRSFYQFQDVDIDRYRFGGRVRQVMLSARELNPDRLSATAQRWVNRRLQYTHGYGFVMSPVNEVDANGRPVFLVENIPLQTNGVALPVQHPQIYYGGLTGEPVIVRTTVPEFDYSIGGAQADATNRYDGKGGIVLGSWLTRALFASYLGDTNLLISDAIRPESRILLRRNIQERVQRLAPFLMYDHDPYLAVADGRLIWIQDAYTTADTYPYSQPLAGRVPDGLMPIPGDGMATPETVNYIRNSVKAVTDAYDGTVQFYVADEADPIVQSYRAIFPSLWRPLSAMPPAFRAHLRYPETLFGIQARMYDFYHVTDPAAFYNQSDAWKVPAEPSMSRSSGASGTTVMTPNGPVMMPSSGSPRDQMEPYYVTMRLPEEKREEFLLILPLIFSSQPNMAAWLAARSDAGHYGELISYVFPRGTQINGPTQVASFINQDPNISQLLTLWGQQGSSVIWGNLLVIPVEKSLLYVVPLFLSATAGGIPEMRRVILFHGGHAVMQPTLAEAIREMFQSSGFEEPAPAAPGAPSGAPSKALPGVPAQIRGLADAAARALDEAGGAQRRGDWAAYGAALKRLEAAIRDLRRATGGKP